MHYAVINKYMYKYNEFVLYYKCILFKFDVVATCII